MGADRKALLANRKALRQQSRKTYDAAMLFKSADLAARLRAAFESTGMTQAAFARACGASRQAVRSWLTTGRIDKVKLLVFAEVTKVSVRELLGQPPDQAAQYPPSEPCQHFVAENCTSYAANAWPFKAFTPADFRALPPALQSAAESYIQGLIAASHIKRNGTTGGA